MHANQERTWVEDGGNGSDDSPRDVSRTAGISAVEALTDADLLAGTRRLVCQSNRVLAALLAHLAEVEARGLHRTRACASLYTYCIYELRMSEDAAYRRVGAARLVKRFPQLLGAIERGELHVTGVLQLGPHLTDANVPEVLARAQFRTKKEIEKLVRLLSPLPDVPSRIEPLGLERPRQRATWGNLLAGRHPVRELPPDERPANWLPVSNDAALPESESVLGHAPARNESLAPDRALTDSLSDAPARIDAMAEDIASTESPAEAAAQTDATAESPTRATAQTDATAESPADTPAQTSATAESAVDGSVRTGEGATNLSGPQRYKVQFAANEDAPARTDAT